MPKKTRTADDSVIVQFIHPGREFHIKSSCSPVDIPWVGGDCSDCDGHSRRLVFHKGEYVDGNGKPKTAQLAFWTEWEARTMAVAMPSAKDDPFAAHWVHTAKTPLVKYPGPLNTDPCVFGLTFKYCCCQQTKNGAMQKLEPGSLVLFGSHMAGQFFLDTVFAVEDKGVPYDASDAKQLSGLGVSKEYRNLSLDRLGSGELVFYRGKRFRPESKNEMYSFVPARLFVADDASCGERFALDIAALNKLLPVNSRQFAPHLNQKFKVVASKPETVLRVWKEVLRQVRQSRFIPAVHFDWPS